MAAKPDDQMLEKLVVEENADKREIEAALLCGFASNHERSQFVSRVGTGLLTLRHTGQQLEISIPPDLEESDAPFHLDHYVKGLHDRSDGREFGGEGVGQKRRRDGDTFAPEVPAAGRDSPETTRRSGGELVGSMRGLSQMATRSCRVCRQAVCKQRPLCRETAALRRCQAGAEGGLDSRIRGRSGEGGRSGQIQGHWDRLAEQGWRRSLCYPGSVTNRKYTYISPDGETFSRQADAQRWACGRHKEAKSAAAGRP